MKFIHAADLHIDSPLRGLEAYQGAPVDRVRHATRDALSRLVQLCLDEQAAFLIVAGDLFDHDWKDFNTALYVVSQFQILDRAGIPIFAIRGNHDSREEMTLKVPWPGQFHLFDHKHAETQLLEQHRVAVHGMSFAQRHVKENLVPRYPAPIPGYFNIGILHTNATGNEEHATYAPCSVKELVDKGYDYWALGHVHEYQVLNESNCHVVYSGNTQGRHIRETGAKGCVVVTVECGEIESAKFVSTDVMRWMHLKLTLESEQRLEDLYTLVQHRVRSELDAADGRLLGVRLEIRGACAAHRELTGDVARQEAETALRAHVGEISDDVWLEKIKWYTRHPIDRDGLREGQDLLGELLRQIDRLSDDESQAKEFAACLQPLIEKTQGELLAGRDDDDHSEKLFDFESPTQLREWLKAAEGLLLNQLTRDE
ncbi:MAG: yhaO [Planctomycetaceae bacterium]|nr:yhaO [Planctomycetaceae bacterium]